MFVAFVSIISDHHQGVIVTLHVLLGSRPLRAKEQITNLESHHLSITVSVAIISAVLIFVLRPEVRFCQFHVQFLVLIVTALLFFRLLVEHCLVFWIYLPPAPRYTYNRFRALAAVDPEAPRLREVGLCSEFKINQTQVVFPLVKWRGERG